MSGDFFDCHTLGEGATGICWGEDNAQEAPVKKKALPPRSTVGRLEALLCSSSPCD